MNFRKLLPSCFWLLFFPTTLYAASANPASSEAAASQNKAQNEKLQTEAAREREKSAEEDPLAQRQADHVDRPIEWASEPDELNLYGSVRIRYRDTTKESFWGDGGSRIGLAGQWQFKPQTWLFGRVEAGIDVLDEIDLLIDRSARPPGDKFGDTAFLRLLYLGVETPDYMLTAGKNWSSYYQVTSFTDRFQGTGASASGTYNAGTDGGYSGTGRADRVIQARVLIDAFEKSHGIKPLHLNLQFQHGEPVPRVDNINYKTTIGISALLETTDDVTLGLAYNHANIDSSDLATLSASGIDGDATALSLGLRWFSKNWYLATVLSRLKNHETTDEFIYFDGTGWEVYGQYNLYKSWWVVGGWNLLEPDSSEIQAGAYKTKYSVLGVRYSFREFRQMLFANVRFESSTLQDGSSLGNVYTIGVRWDLP